MTTEPDERDRIRAAMDRILAGTPERSNGALTVVALAIEAGQLTLELQEARAEVTALGNVTRLDSRRVPARHEGE